MATLSCVHDQMVSSSVIWVTLLLPMTKSLAPSKCFYISLLPSVTAFTTCLLLPHSLKQVQQPWGFGSCNGLLLSYEYTSVVVRTFLGRLLTCLGVFACRYERSQKQAAFGRSLVQRHVALPEDIANEAGEGLLVSTSLLVLVLTCSCTEHPP